MDVTTDIIQTFNSCSQHHKHLFDLIDSAFPPLATQSETSDTTEATLSLFTTIKLAFSRMKTEIAQLEDAKTRLSASNTELVAALVTQKEDLTASFQQTFDRERINFEEKLESQVHFIEELLQDKESKIKEIQEMKRKRADSEAKQALILTQIREKHAQELKKAKEQWAGAEKVRYFPDRKTIWTKEKERQIKEMTAKGLEPELTRLIADYQASLEEAKQTYSRLLAESAETQEEKHRTIIVRFIQSQLKERHAEETESVRKQAQDSFNEKLKRMQEDHEKELKRVTDHWKSRLEEAQSDYIHEKESLRKTLQDAQIREIQAIENRLKSAQATHEEDLRQLTEKYDQEKTHWMQSRVQDFLDQLHAEKAEIRSEAEEKTGRELEEMVKKLAAEQAGLIARLEEKYEAQIEDLKTRLSAYQTEQEMRASFPVFPGQTQGKKKKKKQTTNLVTETPTLSAKTSKNVGLKYANSVLFAISSDLEKQ